MGMETRYVAISVAVLAMVLTACVGTSDRPVDFSKFGASQFAGGAGDPSTDDYYEAHHDGRIYVFDDFATYAGFLQHAETPYRFMRIGGAPDGKTVVFGLTDDDKEKRSGIAAVELWDGQIQGASEGFYGEVLLENRLYVFGDWAQLQDFRITHEAPLRHTRIGEGPGGRTVVFVLDAATKAQVPEKLISEFQRRHGL